MPLEDAGHEAALRTARAWAHPLRLRILSLLTGVELSAAEVARELDITQANASYHLRRLAAAGELEVAGTEKVRGGLGKKYRYVARTHVDRSTTRRRAPDEARMHQLRQALDAELRRRIPAVAAGPGMFADAEVWLPPEVLAQVLTLIERTATLVHENAKPPRTVDTEHVSYTGWLFRMETGDERP